VRPCADVSARARCTGALPAALLAGVLLNECRAQHRHRTMFPAREQRRLHACMHAHDMGGKRRLFPVSLSLSKTQALAGSQLLRSGLHGDGRAERREQQVCACVHAFVHACVRARVRVRVQQLAPCCPQTDKLWPIQESVTAGATARAWPAPHVIRPLQGRSTPPLAPGHAWRGQPGHGVLFWAVCMHRGTCQHGGQGALRGPDWDPAARCALPGHVTCGRGGRGEWRACVLADLLLASCVPLQFACAHAVWP